MKYIISCFIMFYFNIKGLIKNNSKVNQNQIVKYLPRFENFIQLLFWQDSWAYLDLFV